MEMNALELLDYDCWRLVFRKLNGEDLMSCRVVCKPFSLLLDECEFQRKWKFQLIFPHLFEHLKICDFHNLRLICKSWRKSVDEYVSDFHGPEYFSLSTRHFPLANCFYSAEKILEFQRTFGEWKGSPFPAKTVFISNGPDCLREEPAPEEDQEDVENEDAVIRIQDAYITRLTNFMECFGRNIHKLELYFSIRYYGTDYLFLCKLIKGIATHLVNIHTLRVYGFKYEYYRDQRVQDDPEEMATWMGENSLSDLPKLQALQIEELDETTENYLVEKYGPQLTHFQGKYEFPQNLLQQPQVQLFRNLEKLQLELVNHMDTLEAFRFLQCPLKLMKLVLNYDYDEDDEDVEPLTWNVDKALRNLQHLPIECLEIEVYPHVTVAEANLGLEEYINESIQTLSIHFIYFEEVDSGQISFNFLEALRKLENLELKFEAREGAITHPKDLPEVVELHEYFRGAYSLYHSNIWEKIPSLKSLIVVRDGFMNYAREEYGRLERKKE